MRWPKHPFASPFSLSATAEARHSQLGGARSEQHSSSECQLRAVSVRSRWPNVSRVPKMLSTWSGPQLKSALSSKHAGASVHQRGSQGLLQDQQRLAPRKGRGRGEASKTACILQCRGKRIKPVKWCTHCSQQTLAPLHAACIRHSQHREGVVDLMPEPHADLARAQLDAGQKRLEYALHYRIPYPRWACGQCSPPFFLA